MQNQPLDSFSGGWKMYAIALAALLYSTHDVLLLDEAIQPPRPRNCIGWRIFSKELPPQSW
jgi:hypothetical protein